MFKKTRDRIVAAIMSVLVLLFVGTLGVIYFSSYEEVTASNYEMLEHHAERYHLAGESELLPKGKIPPDAQADGLSAGWKFEDTPSFQLSTFYSVAVGDDSRVLDVDPGNRELYDGETLVQYAADILKSGRTKGKKGNLIFLVEKKPGYSLVAFMDNTILKQSMTTLFRHTLIFGTAAIVLLYFLARQLAKQIVRPLEENYWKQKKFISDAGHELKTPVSVVNVNAELLAHEIGENQWLANIRYENERMGDLVAQLLELARTETLLPQMEEVDLSRLVAGSVLPFESLAYEKGRILETEIQERITVNGNAQQLRQLVSILTDNALCHGTSKAPVTVRLAEQRENAVLTVINAGAAIPSTCAAQLFERFYRADVARTGDEKHYGLGLSIAKAIVEGHHGTIEIDCYDGLVAFRVNFPKR